MSAHGTDGVFDSIFNALKWNGRYQVFQIFLVMGCSLPVAFNVMSIVFMGYHNPSTCREVNSTSVFRDNGVNINISSTTNISYGECDITVTSNLTGVQHLPCLAGYQYQQQPKDSSLNSDWDLVCGKESLSDLLQTMYTVGMGIGAIVFTRLSDVKGRKLANCLAGFLFLALSTAAAFIPSYIPLAVIKVAQGAAQMGVSLTGTTITLEAVPTEYRAPVGVIGTLVWALCVLVYTALAYLIRDLTWRQHQLIVGLSPIYYLVMPWLLDESMRWLGAKVKLEIVEKNLRKAARMNRKNEEDMVKLFKEKIAEEYQADTEDKSQSDTERNIKDKEQPDTERNIKDKQQLGPERNTEDTFQYENERNPLLQIFRDRRLLKLTLIVWLMWFTDNIAYYGLSLTSTEFHSDKYIGFGLGALMEVLGAPAFWLTIDRFGRKKTTFGFHVLAGVSLLGSAVFQTYSDRYPSFSIAVTTLSLIGKFAISVSFSILWVYTPELYPTTIRNFTFGLASVVGRVGGLLAPFSRTLYRHHPWVLGGIFGGFCMLVSILVRFLPETGGQELPQTIAEMKKLLKVKVLQKPKKVQKGGEIVDMKRV